ncbi:MAG: response regulator, partial [Candidatus Electrothrix sp. AR3]|nr:response regulator [Candidatus Electrothrix sp. AR3]
MRENRYSSGRILIIDDNLEIHHDIKKIFQPPSESNELNALASAITGQVLPVENHAQLELDSAFQGDEAVSMVRQAKQDKKPYALAYVDMRIPPGPDGLAIIRQLQEEDAQLQYVIITAYSDYSWQDISKVLISADNLLVIKKPFESIEIRQAADALIKKWHLAREYEQAQDALLLQRDLLEKMVKKRTAELEQSNQQLLQEVSKRKRAEKKIRRHRDSLEEQVAQRNAEILRQNRFLNTVINSFPYPFIVIDAKTGKIAASNRAAGKFDNTSKNKTMCYQYSHGLERPCLKYGLVCPLHDVIAHKKPIIVEHLYPDSAGNEQVVEVHACPVTNKAGRVVQVIEYCINITKKKGVEEALIKARKMEMIAVMAGGISHDFNNLLMAIAGNVELALMHLPQEHQAFSFLRDAAEVSA